MVGGTGTGTELELEHALHDDYHKQAVMILKAKREIGICE